MPYLPRLSGRQSLDPAVAEGLLAGRGCCPGAPAGQQALAHVLGVAGPPSEEELAGETAAVAAFLLVTSPVARWGAGGNEPGCAAAGQTQESQIKSRETKFPKARAIGEGPQRSTRQGHPKIPLGAQERLLTSWRGADFRCPPSLKSASRPPQARHWRYSVSLRPMMLALNSQ